MSATHSNVIHQMKLNFLPCLQINYQFKCVSETDKESPKPVQHVLEPLFIFWTSGIPDCQSARTQFISHGAVRLRWNFASQGKMKDATHSGLKKVLFEYLGLSSFGIFWVIGWHPVSILFSLKLPFLFMKRKFKPVPEKAIVFYTDWGNCFKFVLCPVKWHTFRVCAKSKSVLGSFMKIRTRSVMATYS